MSVLSIGKRIGFGIGQFNGAFCVFFLVLFFWVLVLSICSSFLPLVTGRMVIVMCPGEMKYVFGKGAGVRV